MRTWLSACPVCPRSPASRANPENCKSHPKASASDAFFILKPHFSRPPCRAFSSSWRNPPCFRVSSESSAFPSGNPRRGFPAVQRPSCALEGKRISSSAEDDGGAAPRPRRLLQKAGENLGAASPLTHSTAKNKETAALFLQPFPFYTLPILPPKVLERWGPGGGKPFAKGFPPPQNSPQKPNKTNFR